MGRPFWARAEGLLGYLSISVKSTGFQQSQGVGRGRTRNPHMHTPHSFTEVEDHILGSSIHGVHFLAECMERAERERLQNADTESLTSVLKSIQISLRLSKTWFSNNLYFLIFPLACFELTAVAHLSLARFGWVPGRQCTGTHATQPGRKEVRKEVGIGVLDPHGKWKSGQSPLTNLGHCLPRCPIALEPPPWGTLLGGAHIFVSVALSICSTGG